MVYNPVDYKVQDVLVITAGSYVGQLTSGNRIGLKAADVATIKGGIVATITAANEFGICDANDQPFGIFFGDAAKSQKDVSVIFRGGLYEVNNWDITATLSDFALGAKLVSGAAGKLKPWTNEALNLVVAIVTKTPTSTSDTLGIKLLV